MMTTCNPKMNLPGQPATACGMLSYLSAETGVTAS